MIHKESPAQNSQRSFFFDFFQGVQYPLKGILYTLKHPSLWKYLLIPCCLMLVLLSITLITLIFQADHISQWLQQKLWAPDTTQTGFVHSALMFMYEWGLYLGIWIIGIFGAYTCGLILAPPLTEGLSEAIQKQEGWTLVNKDNSLGTTIVKPIFESVVSVILYLCIISILFVLSFLPIVGLCTPVIGALVTAFFMAKELLEVPMGTHQIPLKQRVRYLWYHRSKMFGFGGTCAVLMLLPLANLCVFPFLLVGSTLLYCTTPVNSLPLDKNTQ